MAEGGNTENGKNTMPQRGKVQKVRQEFSVYEDGAYAYQLQNEEINKHYGLNRFHRRTVREDIPIARVVQTDEEVQQQNQRFQELQALRAQAEEDERVAKQLMEQEQLQVQARRMATELTDEADRLLAKQIVEEEQLQNEARKMIVELTDEEFAKAVQEKEKRKYERYLEKKKMHKLKKEREQIERTQQQRSEEARLNVRGSIEDLDEDMDNMNLQGQQAMRVTPAGTIEDDGDFSDFYNLPENLDPTHRQAIQEMQDEELAKLIQEQEHKRSKAEVDRQKLKEIEEQDKRLAQIIQEQDKLKVKKAKQKRKQQEEARRAQEAAQRPPALPPRNDHDHRRYRRNSFIQSMENGPQSEPEPPDMNSPDSSDGYLSPAQIAAEQRLHGDQGRLPNRSGSSNQNAMNNARISEHQLLRNRPQTVPNLRNNLHQSSRGEFNPEILPSQDQPDVERWLASQPPGPRRRLRSDESDHLPDSPSPPGSYHSDDPLPYSHSRSPVHNTSIDTGSHYAVSDPFNFNIAAAIDPTYTRRPNDSMTERKQPAIPRTVPQEDCTELEWDPSVRGSIRRESLSRLQGSACPSNGYQADRSMSTMSSRNDSFHDDAVVSPFVPVQGQKRTGDKGRKSSRRPDSASADAKQKNNCKQQ